MALGHVVFEEGSEWQGREWRGGDTQGERLGPRYDGFHLGHTNLVNFI
jgi:hypothetical protein